MAEQKEKVLEIKNLNVKFVLEEETVEAVGIDEEFALIVQGPDGTRRTVRSGEVSVRGLWGYVE